MHLLGHHVPSAVFVVGAAIAYIANYFILKAFYGRPDFAKCDWRQRLLWGIGLLVPVSGAVILALSGGATIFAFVVVIVHLILGAVAHRLNLT